MNAVERKVLEHLRAQGKLDADTIDRASVLARVYAAAGLEKPPEDIQPEAIQACLKRFPAALSEAGSADWYRSYWDAISRGFGGRLGVGPKAAVVFAVGELVALVPPDPDFFRPLVENASQWCADQIHAQNLN